MTLFDRRSLLIALAAISLPGCGVAPVKLNPDQALLVDIDLEGARTIAASYLKASNGKVSGTKIRQLFVNGDASLTLLRSAIAADFKARKIFIHNGWRLSHTEGELFTLISHTLQQS